MTILLLLLFQIALVCCSQIRCSDQCTDICEIYSRDCIVCLAQYYQRIDSNSLLCECMNNFMPFQNFDSTYCCPSGCRSCDRDGCSECGTFGILVYNITLQANTCTCKQNFYMDMDSGCQCSSIASPSLFYWDILNQQCFACPEGCKCDENGCYRCEEYTNRHILTYKGSNTSTCRCGNGFREVNGDCVCPQNCTCTRLRTAMCGAQSHRYNNSGNWKCIYPYTESNEKCVCSSPFEQFSNPDGKIDCRCKSISSPTLFYTHLQNCYPCMQGCFCNEKGCYKCEYAHIISVNYQCQCTNNFTQTKSGCECIFPSYYFQINSMICHCLSDLNNSKYYFSKSDGKCRVCPTGCTCNENGCVQCQANQFRHIEKISDDEYVCLCMENAYESLEGVCRCNKFYKELDNSTCGCDLSYLPLVFSDETQNICVSCPAGCFCDETGCHRCNEITFRKIMKNSDGIKTCYCRPNFHEVSHNQFCTCNYNHTFNSTSLKCQCLPPFTKDQDENCVCSSEFNTTGFYYDKQLKKCYVCPHNCHCNDLGCVECTADSMRVAFFDTVSELYVCRCFQTAFEVKGYCTMCSNNSYYYSGYCVPCYDCLTCDSRGCLSCPSATMTLRDFKCYCELEVRQNLGGVCACPDGFHRDYEHQYDSCIECPKWCAICSDQEVLQCILCRENAHRSNSPSRNCQCLPGYLEAYPQAEYCCHETCNTCNATQCLTCPQFSHRQVHNLICDCVYPFIEIDKGACICDDTFYLMNGQCFKCPRSCKTCTYSPTMNFVQCTSCKLGMNRNISDANCSCMNGYFENKPVQSDFCIMISCAEPVANCTACLNGRVVTEKGCVCPPGMYQNSFYVCQLCNLKGCLQCEEHLLCIQCDSDNSYYLSNQRCYYYNSSVTALFGYVGSRRLVAQLKLYFNVYNFISTTLTMNKISSHPFQKIQSIPVEIDYFDINKDKIMTFIFQNTEDTQTDIIISLNISYNPSDNPTVLFHQENIYQDIVFGRSTMDMFVPNSASAAMFAGTVILCVCSYVLYVIGFKHNNLVFYLQSLSFMAFVVDNSQITNVVFLHNLRYSYFNYDANPFWRLLPTDYIEKCPGNYYITSIDCNMVRNVGMALLLALIAGILIIMFRVLHFFASKSFNLNARTIYYKKFVYRTVQFFHKTTMFPLIFFSIQTLLNAKGIVIITTNFQSICIALSVIIIPLFIANAFIDIHFNIMTKLYKAQNFVEMVSVIVMSFIIILSKGTNWLVLAMFVVLIKTWIYCALRNRYMKQSQSVILIIPSISSAISVLLVVLKVNRTALIVVHVFNCITIIICNSILTHWFFMLGKFDKIHQKMGTESSNPVIPTQIDLLYASHVSLASTDLEKFDQE